MGLMLALLNLICLLVIPVKSGQPAKGNIVHLQTDFPASSNALASSGIDNALNGCSCAKGTCSCCAHLVVPHIVDEEVKNPPPICIGIPYLKKYAKICLDLYNITWRKHVGGCAKIQVRLLFVIRKDFDLGCFNFDDLNHESKQVVSRILLELKLHQMMVDAKKHQRQNKGLLIV